MYRKVSSHTEHRLCRRTSGPLAGGAIELSARPELESIGGDDRIRTGDGGFADPCLTTWLRRPTTSTHAARDGHRRRPRCLDTAAGAVHRCRYRFSAQEDRPPEADASGLLFSWCRGGDLNSYALRHRPLKTACLPIPPPRQGGPQRGRAHQYKRRHAARPCAARGRRVRTRRRVSRS